MKKFQKKSFRGIYLIVASVMFLTACKEESTTLDQPTTTLGETVVLCHGKAQSFVIKDANGNPECIGFTFSEEALTDLPDKDTETPIPVPSDNGTLVDHMYVDYNAHGHKPAGIYDKPHFDIHFYMISKEEQNKIVIGPEMEILPSAEFVPTDYQPGPGGVPNMGKHWSDVTSKEFNGQPFDYTFIYGSYNGKFIFYEPMVTIAFLKLKQNFSAVVKQPAKVQREGYYPTSYSVSYDATKKIYIIKLEKLTLRHI
ncbi:MAG: hypothetical protein JWQ28_2634 [Pedobacter sp.]|nr:hypothetical protein [Pedobacter sp.]